MTERDAHLLANQLDPWIKTLTVVKDSILRVAKAEAEAKDWESRHTALVDDVALLKTERGLLKQEIDASKIRARAEAETIVKEALTQRDQMIGQAIGLPATMGLYSFIGVAVTSATIIIYGSAVWDPVVLITKFKNPLVLSISLFALCLATLATNLLSTEPEYCHTCHVAAHFSALSSQLSASPRANE